MNPTPVQSLVVDKTTGSGALQFNLKDVESAVRAAILVMVVAGVTSLLSALPNIHPGVIILGGVDLTIPLSGVTGFALKFLLQYLSKNNQ